jgi:uncharacterized membrane protein YgaE (UPF0421/DUF939 family)
VPNAEIIKAVAEQSGRTITERYLSMIKQQIKRESYHWYKTMREGEYEYLHEFKERINEIMDLQKKLHHIIDNNENKPAIQIDAIAELHKLNITLSNYFDVAPAIGITLSTTPETKPTPGETRKFIV